MSERFRYRGPASIGGVQFAVIFLQEDTGPGESLRSWRGMSSFRNSDKPQGFTGNLGSDGPVTVELPDGRSGLALVADVQFDGSAWTVHLQGTGPAPK